MNLGTGQVDVAAGTAAGSYAFDYRICELLNPANCDTASVTVTVGAAAIDAQVDAHRLVHLQDVEICSAVQRSHDAGVDADGVLATVEERGVWFVHEHIRAALA